MSKMTRVDNYFEDLKNRALNEFAKIDPKGAITEKKWDSELGLMEVRLYKGDVFEKAGVSYSSLKINLPGTDIEADVKVFEILTYMSNPKVPTLAISLRYRSNGGDKFMGLCDISPSIVINEDLDYFQRQMQAFSKDYGKNYKDMQKRLNFLFTSKHTGKTVLGGRGIAFGLEEGGFDFFKAFGDVFLDTSLEIIRKRKDESFTPEDRDKQLHDRGKWVEFNLTEDKGFILGVKAGIPPEAMNYQTLPPVAKFHP